MPTVFLTGFPGFLGSALVERLLDRYPADTSLTCLVQPRFRPQAERKAFQIERVHPSRLGRIHLVEGDITLPGLGLGTPGVALQKEIIEVYHFAAVYDLTVKRDVAMRINVEGTRHVLDFAEKCPGLTRFQYVSTCYVSGKYQGIFTESDLEKGQSFNNFYEETKYLAEVEVQRRMNEGLPTTIFRPSIVVGSSITGETQKYDGPYAVILLLLRQFRLALMPVIGDISSHTVNIVPQDYVIDALDYLSSQEFSKNRVYHLANPSPPSVSDVLATLADATDRIVVPVPLPLQLTKAALSHVPFVANLTGINAEGVDYYVHGADYDCTQTLQDLKESAIHCPPFESYASTLVEYVKTHPEVSRKAMV